MAEWKTCPAGHRWEQPSGAGAGAPCPDCGRPPLAETATPSPVSDDSEAPPTTEATPRTLPPFVESGAEPAFLLPGYRIIRELGRGGMGVVYLAREEALDRLVAIKVVRMGPFSSREERQRFVREARLAARLDHPGILKVHAAGEHANCPYAVTEYVEGGSLLEQRRQWPLPPAEAARLAEKLARAVAHAHEKGVTHRDLKPGNVLMKGGQEPVVADFGLARSAEDESALTVSGAVMGTPGYMAPEQALGKKDVGPPADVHALGAILYEMLTGRPPYAGASTLETLDAVRQRAPARPRQLRPDVPAALEAICLCCLEKDPRRRYADAGGLADDLARFLGEQPVRARPHRRRRAALAWAAGVLALLGLVAAWAWRPTPKAAALRAGELKLTVEKSQVGFALPLVVQRRLDRLARQITQLLRDQLQTAIALGDITGPPDLAVASGPILREALSAKLAQLGILVSDRAALILKGEYVLDDEDREGEPILRLMLTIRNKKWRVIRGYEEEIGLNGDDEIVKTLALQAGLESPPPVHLGQRRLSDRPMALFARHIAELLRKKRHPAIALGEITGPPGPALASGPGLMAALAAELKQARIDTSAKAACVLKGEYLLLDYDNSKDEMILRIVLTIRDRMGRVVREFMLDVNNSKEREPARAADPPPLDVYPGLQRAFTDHLQGREAHLRLERLADSVAGMVRSQGCQAVAVADVAGPPEAGPAARLVQSALVARLKKLGIDVGVGAPLILKGECFAWPEEHAEGEFVLRLVLTARNRKGQTAREYSEDFAVAAPASPVQLLVKSQNGKLLRRVKPVGDGDVLAELNAGERFVVRLHNRGKKPIAASVAIDGVDVFTFFKINIDGEDAFTFFHDAAKPGSVLIPPGKSYDLHGWLRDAVRCNAFLVGPYFDSAAAKLLRNAGRLGVVTVKFHPCWRKAAARTELLARFFPDVVPEEEESFVLAEERGQAKLRRRVVGPPSATLTLRYRPGLDSPEPAGTGLGVVIRPPQP